MPPDSPADLGLDGRTYYKGGFGPFVGDWSSIPGLDCAAIVAAAPSEAVPPLKWKPCTSGAPGCRQAVVDWTIAPGPKISAGRPFVAASGRVYLPHQRSYPAAGAKPESVSFDYRIIAVQEVDGPTIFAGGEFRSEGKWCLLFGAAGAGGIVAKAATTAPPGYLMFARAALADPTTTTFSSVLLIPYSSLLPGGITTALQASVGAKRLFLRVEGPTTVAVLDLATGTSLNKVGGASATRIWSTPVPTSGGAIAVDGVDAPRIYFISDAAEFSPIAEVATPAYIPQFAVDPSDNSFVWERGVMRDGPTGPGVYDLELWRSPYATSMSAASPTRIAALPSYGVGLVANRGLVLVTVNGGSEAWLVRVSDGARWTVKPEPGQSFGEPIWVDDTEVWLHVTDHSFGSYPSSIQRTRRDAMGSPTTDAGT